MIRLRAFVILSSLIAVVAALILSWVQMKSVLEKGTAALIEKELEHISQLVRTAINIKKSELKNYSQVIRSNNDLSSTYLIAKESGDVKLVDTKIKSIQNELHFDFSELLTLSGESIYSARLSLEPEAFRKILREKEGVFPSMIQGRPVLISFSPLNLYTEPIAIVMIGYFLDGNISNDLLRSTNAKLRFEIAPPNSSGLREVDTANHRLSFAIDGFKDFNLWATIDLKENPTQSFWALLSTELIFSGAVTLSLLIISLFCFLEFGFMRSFRTFVKEINNASEAVARGEPRDIPTNSSYIFENTLLFQACSKLVSNLIAHQWRMKQQVLFEEAAQKQKALGDLAQQVAHDIRSPLSALEVATHAVTQIPEENRLLIRGAVARIQDIANNLLARRKEIEIGKQNKSLSRSNNSDVPSIQLLSCLVESIVSEKRMQLRHRLDVRIETKLDPSAYGLFAFVRASTFKTVICNLLENSVEAIEKAGSVLVSLKDNNDEIELSIKDNGKGIAPEWLPQLAQRGLSFDKANGSGLGLFYAKTSVERWGGSLEITSSVGAGTQVQLVLPKALPPRWFVPAIEVGKGQTVVVVDDDVSIHDIWETKFTQEGCKKSQIVHLSAPEQLSRWKISATNVNTLYLIDYEFLGTAENGLSLIESLGIAPQSILVTNRYEDARIVERCLTKNIPLIPKVMAGFVPIHLAKRKNGIDDPIRFRTDVAGDPIHAL